MKNTTKKPRTYYTLAQFYVQRQAWFPQFGDFDKAAVKAEMEDYKNAGERAANLAIVPSLPDQESINAAIAAL